MIFFLQGLTDILQCLFHQLNVFFFWVSVVLANFGQALVQPGVRQVFSDRLSATEVLQRLLKLIILAANYTLQQSIIILASLIKLKPQLSQSPKVVNGITELVLAEISIRPE